MSSSREISRPQLWHCRPTVLGPSILEIPCSLELRFGNFLLYQAFDLRTKLRHVTRLLKKPIRTGMVLPESFGQVVFLRQPRCNQYGNAAQPFVRANSLE